MEISLTSFLRVSGLDNFEQRGSARLQEEKNFVGHWGVPIFELIFLGVPLGVLGEFPPEKQPMKLSNHVNLLSHNKNV